MHMFGVRGHNGEGNGVGQEERGSYGGVKGRRTEDKFLCWRHHIESECGFILIAFYLEPPEGAIGIEYCWDEENEENGGNNKEGWVELHVD